MEKRMRRFFLLLLVCMMVCSAVPVLASEMYEGSSQEVEAYLQEEEQEEVMQEEEQEEESQEEGPQEEEPQEEEPQEEVQENVLFQEQNVTAQVIQKAKPSTPSTLGVPEGTVTTRDAWYPTASTTALNKWQIVSGSFLDNKNGATTQKSYDGGNIILRKNVIPTDQENIFEVALKIRAKASWSDLLDATSARVQNGNSDNSSKANYFEIRPTSSNSKAVTVYFMNAPISVNENSLPGNYKLVYKKTYYIDPSITGEMFLYFNNPLLGTGDHGGQKQAVVTGSKFYIPVGTWMENYSQLHHAAVARSVTDTMGPGMEYIKGSVKYKTTIPGVNGLTSVTENENTLTWNIDTDGTIGVGEDYQLVYDSTTKTYYREYDLVYKVHLDTSREDFVSGKEYVTNSEAKLTYSYDPRPEPGSSDYQDYEKGEKTALFPVPSVKGTLYQLKLTKKDEDTGEVLKGAEFTLSGKYGVSKLGYNTNIYQKDISQTVLTDENGIAEFTGLPWGDYTLKETKAPMGYDITFVPETYTLCYTTNKAVLLSKGTDYELKASEIGINGVITNKSWPIQYLTLTKKVVNPDEIILESDKEAEFPITLTGIGDDILFFTEAGEYLENSKLCYELQDGESKKLMVKMKTDHTISISENLDSLSHFKLNNIKYTVGTGLANITDSDVTMRVGKDISIQVENEYIPQVTDVTIEKEDVNGNPLSDAEFTIYTSIKRDASDDAETYTYDGNIYYELNIVTTEKNGQVKVKKLSTLENPIYLIRETKAPEGYFLLENPIRFIVDEEKNITMIEDLDDVSLEKGSDNLFRLCVINHLFYSLPNSGGMGTYLFTISGVAVMTFVLLMFIYDKRRKRGDL